MAKESDKKMMKSISVKIMLARDRVGLTREQLSELAGIEANSIYRYETAKQVPNFPTVIRIAKALNVSVADIVPDEYMIKNQEDPEGVLEFFYQMDKADQIAMFRQMKAMIIMKKVG